MIYHLRHRTTFDYSQPVTFVYNTLHLKPRTLPWQTVRSSELTVLPIPAVLTEKLDYFGNHTTFCSVQEHHSTMQVQIQSVVEVLPRPLSKPGGVPWEKAADQLWKTSTPEGLDASQFSYSSPMVPLLEDARLYALPSCRPGLTVHQVGMDLMHRIKTDFVFDATATNVATPIQQVLKDRRGVCQDFAHVMISCLRSIGLPARYNSGYIQTTPPPGQPRLEGADASHAWIGLYCPEQGWLDLDPTNDKPADEQFITIGWGRDYGDVSPLQGVLMGGGKHQVRAEVDMIPEYELTQKQKQQQQQQQ